MQESKAMENVGRILMIGGAILLAVGAGAFLLAKLGLPLGHLPGDIYIQGKLGSFYFPLTTCILISVLLTILVNLALWIFKK
jgi:hypothetical protein